jgi:hypothetical protein
VLASAGNEIAFLEECLRSGSPNDLHLVHSDAILAEVRPKLVERFDDDPCEAAVRTNRLGVVAVRLSWTCRRGRRHGLVVDVDDAEDVALLVSLDDVEIAALGEAVLEELADSRRGLLAPPVRGAVGSRVRAL